MTYIDNIHQPFVFNNGEFVHILVTEIQNEKYKYKMRNGVQVDDKWKIKLLDENLELISINTPNEIIHGGLRYEIYSECSPFIYNNKMSYVATSYTEEHKGRVEFFLIQGDMDFTNYNLLNTVTVGKYYSAIMKNDEIIYVDNQNNKITSTKLYIPKFQSMLDRIIRVMGIDGSDNLLITGVKSNSFRTLLWVHGTENFYYLTTNENDDRIYKSSIYGDQTDGMLVFTEKALPDNETKKYKLNINMGYKLI